MRSPASSGHDHTVGIGPGGHLDQDRQMHRPGTVTTATGPAPDSRPNGRWSGAGNGSQVVMSSTSPQRSAVGASMRVAGQRQPRRAVAADPPGQADRAAGAGHQAERDLRQADAARRGRRRRAPANAGSSIPAPRHAPWRCTSSRSASWCDELPGAAGQPDDVGPTPDRGTTRTRRGRRRCRTTARCRAARRRGRVRRSADRQRVRPARRASADVDGVVARRPVEHDVHDIAGALDDDRRLRRRAAASPGWRRDATRRTRRPPAASSTSADSATRPAPIERVSPWRSSRASAARRAGGADQLDQTLRRSAVGRRRRRRALRSVTRFARRRSARPGSCPARCPPRALGRVAGASPSRWHDDAAAVVGRAGERREPSPASELDAGRRGRGRGRPRRLDSTMTGCSARALDARAHDRRGDRRRCRRGRPAVGGERAPWP